MDDLNYRVSFTYSQNKEDPSSIVTGSERPVVPKSLMVPSGTTGAEMETQEISADFSTDDDEEGEEDDAAAETKSAPAGIDAPSEVLRWGRPGSLIPSRVTRAVFGYHTTNFNDDIIAERGPPETGNDKNEKTKKKKTQNLLATRCWKTLIESECLINNK